MAYTPHLILVQIFGIALISLGILMIFELTVGNARRYLSKQKRFGIETEVDNLILVGAKVYFTLALIFILAVPTIKSLL